MGVWNILLNRLFPLTVGELCPIGAFSNPSYRNWQFVTCDKLSLARRLARSSVSLRICVNCQTSYS